jgi:hypothetical protein
MADANINIGVNVNSKSISQLEAQLTTLNAKIKTVAVGSAEFTKLTTQIQTVEKSLIKANSAIKGFNPEETFGRLAKVAGGVGAAFAAANLFIGENEDATKASAEAQKALVAVLGLSQVAEAALSAFQLVKTNALLKSTEALVANSTATKVSAVEAEFAAGAYATEAEAVSALTVALGEKAIVEKQATIESANAVGRFDAVIKEASTGAVVAGVDFDELSGKIRLVGKAGEDLNIEQVGEKLDTAGKAAETFGDKLKNIGKSITAFVSSTGFIVGAIAAIAAALFLYAKSVSDAEIATLQYGVELETLSKTVEDMANKMGPTIKALTIYNSLLESGSLTAEERTRYEGLLRKELEKQGLTQEEVNRVIRQGATDIDAYIASLLRQAKAIAVQEELVQVYKDIFKIQSDLNKSAPNIGQSILNYALTQGDLLRFRVKQLQTTAENYNEELGKLESKAKSLEEILKGAFQADPAAAAQGKKELDTFLKSTEDGIKKTATDITAFLNKVRDERVKAELEGRAEELKIAQNSTKDQLDELKKQRDEFLKDDTLTKTQKQTVEKNYQAGVVAITKNGADAVAEINRTYDQKALDRKKENLDARISLEEQALDTEIQLYQNANSAITNSEVDALKQQETLLQKQIQIDLKRLENLKTNFEEQKKQLEEAKKLAKPEDQQTIQNQIDALVSNFQKQSAALSGQIIETQNKTVQTVEQIQLKSIDRQLSLEELRIIQTTKIGKKRDDALIQAEKKSIEEKLKVVKEGSDEEIELRRRLALLNEQIAETEAQRRLRIAEDLNNKLAALGNQFLALVQQQQNAISAGYDLDAAKIEASYKDRFALIDEETKKLDELEQTKDKNLTATERKRRALAKQRADLEAQQAAELQTIQDDQTRSNAEAAIKQAELQFALTSGQAVANGALAVIKAFSELGPIAGPIAAVLIGATTAAQIATASAAKDTAIAQAQAQLAGLGGGFQTARRVSKAAGGLITGPGNGVSDSVPANLSDGEFVVNANATQKYLPLLSALNSSGLQGGNPVNPSAGNNDMVALLQRIDDKLSQPNRAYVVATDIEDIQNKQNYINRRSNVL